jgi:hypothetical protein
LPGLRKTPEAQLEVELEPQGTETVGSKTLTDRLCPSLMCIQDLSLVAGRMTSARDCRAFSASINSARKEIHEKRTRSPCTRCVHSVLINRALTVINLVQSRQIRIERSTNAFCQSESGVAKSQHHAKPPLIFNVHDCRHSSDSPMGLNLTIFRAQ